MFIEIQRLIETITTFGLLFDLLGALLVVVPDSKKLQRIFGMREKYELINKGKQTLLRREKLEPTDEGFEEISNILLGTMVDKQSVIHRIESEQMESYNIEINMIKIAHSPPDKGSIMEWRQSKDFISELDDYITERVFFRGALLIAIGFSCTSEV